MSKKIIAITSILVATCMILITGCYKAITVIPQGDEVTRAVSFKDDLMPIFASSCSLSGCHTTGGIKPDLSPDKSYNSIINFNYVDITTPDNSEIYLWLTGKRAVSMPVGATNNPSNINQLILAWVKQGATNN